MPDLAFVVNDWRTLVPDQTTALLVAAAAARGHDVWVTPSRGVGLTPDGVQLIARRVSSGGDAATVVAQLASARDETVDASELDGVWVRTNPGRAEAGAGVSLLELLVQVEAAGVPVRNRPAGLQRAASKLYLGELPPSAVPRTWASADPARLRAWLAELGAPGVIKPALGTRGEGTARVQLDDPALAERLAEATRSGPALLQAYVAEAPAGDLRVHVVDGVLLEVDGAAAVVRRVPGEGEWRSNVALGGVPTAAGADDALRDLIGRVGPTLVAHGLWHVGLDVVGDRIVECNVFSPGGLGDIARFTGVDFAGPLVDAFVDAISGPGDAPP